MRQTNIKYETLNIRKKKKILKSAKKAKNQ